MFVEDSQIDALLQNAEQGDPAALKELLARHRGRLRQMVLARMDSRLRVRIDPSDVVQDVLTQAYRKLPAYLEGRPLPFYPWLRQIAWERLVQLHREHVIAQKRSVRRERDGGALLSDESVQLLAEQIMSDENSPSRAAYREEVRRRVRRALSRLDEDDHEVVVMRHLEGLRMAEIAALLGITHAAAQSRYRRAAERLHGLLSGALPEELP